MNIAPENRPSQKETIVFQPSMNSGAFVVSFREGTLHKSISWYNILWYLVTALALAFV